MIKNDSRVWTAAFISAVGKTVNIETAFHCLESLVPAIKKIPKIHGSRAQAVRFRQIMCTITNNYNDITVKQVTRFISLLIEKNKLKNIDVIVSAIEHYINEKNKIYRGTLETAFPISGETKLNLENQIAKTLGAEKILLTIKDEPNLLAGFVLQINDFYIDASLKNRIEKMKEDLQKTVDADGISINFTLAPIEIGGIS